jgi:excisionase family DNA binding protein
MTYYTVEDVAEKLHMGEDAIRRKAAEGSIPARKVGKRWLFHPDLLDKYLRNEWRSTNENPAVPGGSDSHLAARLFAEAAVLETAPSPRNTKPRSGRGTSGNKN